MNLGRIYHIDVLICTYFVIYSYCLFIFSPFFMISMHW